MDRPTPPILRALLVVVGFTLAGRLSAQWVAYNDHYYGATTHTNCSIINVFGAGNGASGSSGFLRNIVTGERLTATLTITNRLVVGATQMASPAAGTPAGDLFLPWVHFGSGAVNHSIVLSNAAVVAYVFTGLDPARAYLFQGTAARGNTGFGDRWTQVSIAGADYAEPRHTRGVLTNGQLPGLIDGQAAWNSGANNSATTGDWVGWGFIRPGADGSFTVICEVYSGLLTNGLPAARMAYAFSALRLEESLAVPAGILRSPTDTSAPYGTPAELSVDVTGTPPISFAWLRNGSFVPGATNRILSFPALALTDAGDYTVTVTNSAGGAISESARLTVGLPIPVTIEQQPTNVTVTAQVPVELRVVVTGSEPVSYQWFRNGSSVPGATNPVLSFASAGLADQGAYQVVVSNVINRATSEVAVLTVLYVPPVITGQPLGATLYLGSTTSLAVATAGSDLRYQWFRNDAPLPGQTNRVLAFPGLQLGDAGAYRVVVSNLVGVVISDPAYLLVQRLPVTLIGLTNQLWRYYQAGQLPATNWFSPGFDDGVPPWATGRGVFAIEDAGNQVVIALTNTGLASSGIGGRVLAYYFRTTFEITEAPHNVQMVITNLFDDGAVVHLNGSELYRYNMPTGAVGYATTASSAAPEGVFFQTNVPAARLVRGTNLIAVEVHQVVASSTDVVHGTAATLIFPPESPLAITNQPVGTRQEELRPARFSVGVAGTGAGYQWFHDSIPISGATGPELTLPAVTAGDAGIYDVTVSNVFGLVRSTPAVLEVYADVIPPVLLAADGAAASTNVLASFSEPIDLASISLLSQFSLTNTLGEVATILSVVQRSGTELVFHTTPRLAERNYILTVNGVRDLSTRGNGIATNSAAPVATRSIVATAAEPPGSATWFVYSPLPGLDPLSPGPGWEQPDFPPDLLATWGRSGPPFVTPFLIPPEPWEANGQLTPGVITHFLRRPIVSPSNSADRRVRLRILLKDGAAIFWNGVEVARHNLPAVPLTPTIPATVNLSVPLWFTNDIPPELASQTDSFLAVELHSSGLNAGAMLAIEVTETRTSIAAGPVVILGNLDPAPVVENHLLEREVQAVGGNRFQWYLNGEPIPGQTNYNLRIPHVPASWNGALLSVRAMNVSSSATSAPVRLTILPDREPPGLLSAVVTGPDRITVRFDEALGVTSGTTPANYLVRGTAGEITPVRDVRAMDDRSVELILGDPGASQVTLSVNDITDLAGNCVHPGSRVSLGYNLTIVPINATTMWRYRTDSTAPPAGWRETGFDDSNWQTGAPLFASTPSFTFIPLDPVRTQLGLSSAIPTLYFRHSFEFRGDPAKVSLTMRHIIDDGAVFHLNATQVLNVAVGSTDHGSLALRSVADAVYEGPVTLPTTSLRVGTNTVAVQVHQVATTSTDVVMGMEWTLQAPSEVLPPDGTIPPGRIRIEPSAAGAVLWWDGCGRILQEAASLAGAQWVDVPGASSPHPLPGPAGRARFFRLVDRR